MPLSTKNAYLFFKLEIYNNTDIKHSVKMLGVFILCF